jgi:hypothetical protein
MSTHSRLCAFVSAAVFAPLASAQIAFQPSTSQALIGFRPDSAVTGDFDGVNGIDFAVATGGLQGGGGPDRVEIFLNQGNGTFVAGQAVVVGNNADAGALVSADFDRDGDLDLAVVLKNAGTLRVLINTGGVFAAGAPVAIGGIETVFIAAADVDGDADLDLVASNRSSNTVSVLRNDGTGAMTLSGALPVGLEPRDLALDDFNGDCRTDIAVAAHDARRVDVLFNTGTGSFGAPVSFPVPGNEKPSGMVAADLDADGDVDLATTTDNNNVGIVVVMRNAGNGTFAGRVVPSSGLNPSSIVAGDFDADGDKDLATADEDANIVSVLPNLGAGTFGGATALAVGVHPDGIATADFDGNGSLDLVTANRDSNNASVLLNATTGGSNAYCLTTPNVAGFGARMDSTGSLSVSSNSFVLLTRCAPPGTTGMFFYGNSARTCRSATAAAASVRRCSVSALRSSSTRAVTRRDRSTSRFRPRAAAAPRSWRARRSTSSSGTATSRAAGASST